MKFMQKFNARDPTTLKEARQRLYFVGGMPDGSSPPQQLALSYGSVPHRQAQEAGGVGNLCKSPT